MFFFFITLYIYTITRIKFWYGFKVLKSDKPNDRNLPLVLRLLQVSKLYCWKYGCQLGFAGLGLVGMSFFIDSMLEAGNPE